MVVKKRSKRSRARGSWTHGGGSKKKRRGAGSRGGRGRGGFGKRGQQQMPTAQARKEKLGKSGFYRHGQKIKFNPLNLDDLNRLIEQGKIKEGKVDLKELGYNKLLGSGKISVKLQIKVNYFSKKAEEKIKAAGGEILAEKIKTQEKEAVSTPKEKPEQ